MINSPDASSMSPSISARHINWMIFLGMILSISSMDIYLPAMPLLATYFKVSEFMMQVSLMMNPVASALVGLLFGRMGDIYGRRPMILYAIGFFLLGSIGCTLSTDFHFFLASRFVQAIGTGGLSVLSVVVITDVFKGAENAKAMALYGSLFPVVFALAPILGAFLMHKFGWRSNFSFLVIGMSIMMIFMAKYLPETHPHLPKNKLVSEGKTNQSLMAHLHSLIKNRDFVLAGLVHALPISMGALFTANAAFIFIQSFHFSPMEFSLAQALPVSINFITAIVYRRALSYIGIDRAMKIGGGALVLFTLGAAALLLKILPSLPTTYLMLFCVVNVTGPLVVSAAATKAYSHTISDRGLAVSLVSLFRNLSSGLIVMTTGLFFNGTFVPVLTSMILICIVVLYLLYLLLKSSEHFRASNQAA